MTMTTIINLTPHAITIPSVVRWENDEPIHSPWTLAPSGTIARAVEESTPDDPIGGNIPTTRVRYTGVEGLPAISADAWCVVSSITAQAAHASGRATHDLLVPGQQIRDESGRVVGCGSLIRWQPDHEPCPDCQRNGATP